MQIPHKVESNKSIIKCYYSQNKCESKQMSVGGLVGLRVMSSFGKTTASAFLADDGSVWDVLSTEECILFFRGTHTWEIQYLGKELVLQEESKGPLQSYFLRWQESYRFCFSSQPNHYTKYGWLKRGKVEWYWHEGLITISIFLKQCHVMPKEVNPWSHCSLT